MKVFYLYMRIVLVHGFEGDRDIHWFGWLEKQLVERHCSVVRKTYSNSDAPDPLAWQQAIASDIQEDDIVVGFSLGVAGVLRALELSSTPRIETFVSVSGFARPLDVSFADKINSFVEGDFDWECITSKMNNAFVYASDDDPYVPMEEAQFLSEKLGASFRVFHARRHLGTWDETQAFPELLESILQQKI